MRKMCRTNYKRIKGEKVMTKPFNKKVTAPREVSFGKKDDEIYTDTFKCVECGSDITYQQHTVGKDPNEHVSDVIKMFGQGCDENYGKPVYLCNKNCFNKYVL